MPTPAAARPGPGPQAWLTRNLAVLTLVSLTQDAASELLYPLLPPLITDVLAAPRRPRAGRRPARQGVRSASLERSSRRPCRARHSGGRSASTEPGTRSGRWPVPSSHCGPCRRWAEPAGGALVGRPGPARAGCPTGGPARTSMRPACSPSQSASRGSAWWTAGPLVFVLLAVHGLLPAFTDGVGRAWISTLVPDELHGRAQGVFQGLNSGAILLAGTWAARCGRPVQGSGAVPLVIAGCAALVAAALMIGLRRRVA